MRTSSLINKKDGFTIIEVVLVLAIAGLIFLLVFTALPQLQRSRRDTQRRSDAGRIAASMETYASNANGAYPNSVATQTAFIEQYVTGKLTSPDATAYTVDFGTTNLDTTTARNAVRIAVGRRCNGPTFATGGGASARTFAVQMRLEEGIYCQDNL